MTMTSLNIYKYWPFLSISNTQYIVSITPDDEQFEKAQNLVSELVSQIKANHWQTHIFLPICYSTNTNKII